MTGFLIWVDEPGPEWDNKEGLIPAGIEELKNEYPIPSAFRFYMGRTGWPSGAGQVAG